MSNDRGFCALSPGRRNTSGVALVVTLALLVLVTVAVVAFFSRTSTNQQITSSSANGVVATTFADGAAQEIIGGLQQEMWDVSGRPAAPTNGGPTIFPITSVPGSIPSRMVRTTASGDSYNLQPVPLFPGDGTTQPDPNADYAQFANLVKQSVSGVPTYNVTTGTTTATGSKVASAVHTITPSVDGRTHDGVYWSQPRLVSTSDATALAKLVPDWIYTDRSGGHPTGYTAKTGMEPAPGGTLAPKGVVGRYAYNIYDIGGLLNANVAGYGALNGTPTDATKPPSYADNSQTIVPGYKGSVMMADLGALALAGGLTTNGATATSLTNWQSKLPAFRYAQADWQADFATLYASGQYGGWLSPFLQRYNPTDNTGTPVNTTAITNKGFTSRQDLISWVNSQWGANSSGGSASWILPYLTQFSFDTDAPSYMFDPARPLDTLKSSAGGNDVLDLGGTTDKDINPGFLSDSVLDANGYPMVKRRFPLSMISLFNDYYPGKAGPSGEVAERIKYDFGLVWDATNNHWNYQDMEGNTGSIQRLSVIPKTRSPNFFELLKATITAGSLGKQWGETASGDPNNVLGASRSSSLNWQIIQIGANILSQATTNYFPVPVTFGGADFYGVKDLPYLYRSRVVSGILGTFGGSNMCDVGKPHSATSPAYSKLGVLAIQPEIWNPHAPNASAVATSHATYPTLFRVVPSTANPMVPYTYQGSGTTSADVITWQNGGTLPGIVYGNYSGAGGPNCGSQFNYKGVKDAITPTAYIEFSAATPNSSLPSAPNSYREPCPLAAVGFPDGSVKGSPAATHVPTAGAGASYVFQTPADINTQFAIDRSPIPPIYTGYPTSSPMLGFLAGYFCSGPGGTPTGAGGGYALSITNLKGGPLEMDLQYNDNGRWYTYDHMSSAYKIDDGGFGVAIGSQQTVVGTRVDPRSQRWGCAWAKIQLTGPPGPYGTGTSLYPGVTSTWNKGTGEVTNDLTQNQGKIANLPTVATLTNSSFPTWTVPSNLLPLGWLQINQSSKVIPAETFFYADPDGVVRPADGAFAASGSNIGLPEVMPQNAGNPTISNGLTYESRPVVLNRPFQSVAELGYVFRDTPWRSLDFFNQQSGDTALLDVFCVYGPDPYSYRGTLSTETGLVSGRINLNTRQIPVLAALISGASVTTPTSGASNLTVLKDTPGNTQVTKIAQALVKWTTASDYVSQGPLRNPAELVGKYTGVVTTPSFTPYSGFSSKLGDLLLNLAPSSPNIIKQERECVMHALADSGMTRTWNLLIDLVAQTGTLTTSPQDLKSFVINGERHVWVSVAIDRATGKVIKIQSEPVRL